MVGSWGTHAPRTAFFFCHFLSQHAEGLRCGDNFSVASSANEKRLPESFLCLFLAECVRHSPAPPAPPHLFPVCLATMRLLPPQPTQRLVTALLLFVRYADYAQSKSFFLADVAGGRGEEDTSCSRRPARRHSANAFGPTLQSAVCGVANPFGLASKNGEQQEVSEKHMLE